MRQAVSDESITQRSTKTGTAVAGIAGFGALLTVGFFPALFGRVALYDDEGALLVTMRRFLDHGSLYDHTHGGYGPFYYSFYGLIYRATGQSPTPFSGRLIVLGLTALSACVFAATVWRVTRSMAFTLFAELLTFSVLIRVAGSEPTHPGTLIVLLLSMLLYGLASYALEPKNVFLVLVGVATGALLMCKINVGLFAVTAIVVAFVVGNRRYPKSWRTAVATAALLLPFLLMAPRLYKPENAEFATLVAVGLFLAYAPMHVDVVTLPRRALFTVAVSALAPMFAAVLWPLASGTSPTALVRGVLIRPTSQAENLALSPFPTFEWLAFLFTIAVAYVVLAHAENRDGRPFTSPGLSSAALGLAGLYVLELGVQKGPFPFLNWLPGIAMLPALALLAGAPARMRLVLRFLVPVVILQSLHAYPVVGAQRVWGLVAICVPCVIAMAVAADRLALWQRASRGARALTIGALSLVFLVVGATWPVNLWHAYATETPLNLPGSRLVRSTEARVVGLRKLTTVVRQRCDTFYAAPGFGSLYIFTGLPTPTGMLANWPGVLDDREQRELASQLATLSASGARVCIVRDLDRQQEWLQSSYGKGPLGKSLAQYKARIATVSHYSVSVQGKAPKPRP
jgi:hypothetical protein